MEFKRFAIISALVMIVMGAQAKVRLPHILGDNMVLQQQSEARLWGWAKAGKTVKVSVAWSDAVYTVKPPRGYPLLFQELPGRKPEECRRFAFVPLPHR